MKKSLLKTMLVAIGMAAGTMGAGAQENYTQIYQRSTSDGTVWSEADITDWGGSEYLNISSDYGLGGDVNMTYTSVKTFETTENAKVKYDVVWHMGSSTGRDNNFAWIQFGDAFRLSWSNGYRLYLNTNGASSRDNEIWSGSNQVYDQTISLTINTATRQVEEFLFNGENMTASATGVLEGNFNSVSMGFIRGGSVGWTVPNFITSISVSECEQSVSTANYTVSFKDQDGNEVKQTETRTGVVGETITITDGDLSEFYTGEGADRMKYIYVSNDAADKTIASDGSTVVTVTYRKAATWNYTVNAVCGDNTLTLAQASDFEGETITAPYPRYLLDDAGNIYTTSTTNNQYNHTFTLDENNKVEQLNYSAHASNVVFLVEGEDIKNAKVCKDGNAAIRASNSKTGYNDEQDLIVTSVPAGKYKIIAGVFDAANNPTASFDFVSGGTTIFTATTTNVNLCEVTSDEFILNNVTNEIVLKAGGGSRQKSIDYIYIQKTGDISVTTSITSAGWATLYSDKALDFTGTGVKAYIGTVNGSSLTLTEVTTVPAETAVIIEGEEGPYDIPVIESSETNVAANVLKGTLEEITLTNDTEYDYYAMKVLSNNNVGFALVADEGTVIPAGKAYLQLRATTEAAKVQFFSLGGETTGIEAVETQAKEDGKYYNLMGVEVENPQKGIYIKNGKKVVIK